LVYFFPFGYVVPRKIWQPCDEHEWRMLKKGSPCLSSWVFGSSDDNRGAHCHWISYACRKSSIIWSIQRKTLFLLFCVRTRWTGLMPGLPDFSRHKIPKREINYQRTTKCTYGHKIYQMAVKYSKWSQTTYSNIFHSGALQNIPKLVILVWKLNHLATLADAHLRIRSALNNCCGAIHILSFFSDKMSAPVFQKTIVRLRLAVMVSLNVVSNRIVSQMWNL
jgi:hypothetical protein